MGGCNTTCITMKQWPQPFLLDIEKLFLSCTHSCITYSFYFGNPYALPPILHWDHATEEHVTLVGWPQWSFSQLLCWLSRHILLSKQTLWKWKQNAELNKYPPPLSSLNWKANDAYREKNWQNCRGRNLVLQNQRCLRTPKENWAQHWVVRQNCSWRPSAQQQSHRKWSNTVLPYWKTSSHTSCTTVLKYLNYRISIRKQSHTIINIKTNAWVTESTLKTRKRFRREMTWKTSRDGRKSYRRQ